MSNNLKLTDKDSCTPLCEHVRSAVEEYFAQLDGHSPGELYNLVMQEAEKPLIKTTLSHCGFNQSKAAIVLGISRSTLRKKMALYNLE
ncbi:MAG: Fis family transcriptional regulator [Gammaproteobacteria bacterium]|nr:MAG: Fis family transcriptional regulator [Gammaproteobacteria bacterium]RLA20705.1 MAG: Fis family transcriptional regulator [Gammaproteobacteria bacterium]